MAETILRKHFMLTLRLNLAYVDIERLRAMTGVLPSQGVKVTTLEEEQVRCSDALQRAYLCHNACRLKQPPVELRREPLAFDLWSCHAPDLYFVARHGQAYIGVCLFEPIAQRPDALLCGFTGVLPEWEGHGVARALKAYALMAMKERGFQTVETSNLMINRGMMRINTALGFQIVGKRLHSYPIPIQGQDE